MKHLRQEITPINEEDLFVVLNHPHAKFDYDTHFHSDYEINLVLYCEGKRIVGDNISTFKDIDLAMIGPNIPHRWVTNKDYTDAHVVTIQFHKEALEYEIINKNIFRTIKTLLENSIYGIEFDYDTKISVKDKVLNLHNIQGVESALEFLSILHILSTSPKQHFLLEGDSKSHLAIRESKSRRIHKVMTYVETHFHENISLATVANRIGMSESAFSHFFKKRTNRSFIDFLNDIRIGHASKLLYETSNTVAEVSFLSGFNNISNFNRIFKKKKGQTPSEYRDSIQKIMTKF